jgi:hypothetical protein
MNITFLVKTLLFIGLSVYSAPLALYIYDTMIRLGDNNEQFTGKYYLGMVIVVYIGLIIDIILF